MNGNLSFMQQPRYSLQQLRMFHPLAGYSHLLDPIALAQLSLAKNSHCTATGYLNSLTSLVSSPDFSVNGYLGQRCVYGLSPKSDINVDCGSRSTDKGNFFLSEQMIGITRLF